MKPMITVILVLALTCQMVPQAGSAEDGFALIGSGEMRREADATRFILSYSSDGGNGFKRNDWFLRGTIQNNTFTGEIHVHFVPVEQWSVLCPAKWDTSLPATITRQEGANKWVGSYRSPRITSDCSYETEQGKDFTFELDPAQMPNENVGFNPNLPPAVATEKPARLWISLSTFSAPVGANVPVAVVVAGSKDVRTVIADHDIPVQLKYGEQRSDLTIRKGQSYETTSVTSTTAGWIQLEASGAGLDPGKETLPFCDNVPVNDFLFSYDRQEAPADGQTPIPITLTFQNIETGKPTSGNAAKAVQVLSKGVGIWTVDGHTITPGPSEIVDAQHCALRREVISNQAGTATITLTFRTESKSNSFNFVAYLDWVVFFWIIGGALAGASVRIWQRRSRHRTWKAVIMQFFIGCMSGIVIFLAFYLGFAIWPTATMPVSLGADFLIGFIGGFVGSAGITWIARLFEDLLKPGSRPSGGGRSGADTASRSATGRSE